jgi:Spy/CpxP family protein refolding chaperone
MRFFISAVLIAVLAVGAGALVTHAQDATDSAEALAVEASDDADSLVAILAQAPAGRPPALTAPDLRQRLNLTEEQTRKITEILTGHRDRTARLQIAMARARLDVRELMLNTSPDRARLEALSRRIGELHGQLVAARLTVTLEIRQVLTPEQLNRFRAFLMQRWGERRSRPR